MNDSYVQATSCKMTADQLTKSMEKILKVVVVGDAFVGKTSLLFAYTQNRFPENYNTTVFENWAVSVNIDAKKYTLNLFDTAGQEDYARLRGLSYPGTDAFLLCFSVTDRQSLYNCEQIWMKDIHDAIGVRIPVVLVGTKLDLRNDFSGDRNCQEFVSKQEATRFAKRVG